MIKKILLLFLFAYIYLPVILFAQHPTNHSATTNNIVTSAEPQPLLAQAIRLNEALSFLGSSLSSEDQKRLIALQKNLLHQKQHIISRKFLILIVLH